ncbi:MAG: hypothetical protein SF187_28970 [Deltaproteobacteria bacterium]|nr:hypothetical protein [Deltaproteobacteria bacterium]
MSIMVVITPYVAQGSLSIIAGRDEAIIVDSYIPPQTDRQAAYVKAALSKAVTGKRVTGLVITGWDDDHADHRGIAWILGKYRPDWVMHPQYRKFTTSAMQVFKTLKEHTDARAGTASPLNRIPIRLDRIEERTFTTLSAEWDIEVFSPHPEDMCSSNNCSLVAKVFPKEGRDGFRYLITGDTENLRWESINRIFGKALRADVMAAPHHGSRNGINEETLGFVSPGTVLISAGVGNQFEHPHREALDLYAASGADVYSTHTGKSFQTAKGWLWGTRTTEWTAREA